LTIENEHSINLCVVYKVKDRREN